MYLELNNISKKYNTNPLSTPYALNNINLSIDKGCLASVLGPSGCGKTTLLRIIAGLDNPTTGDIFINGKHVNNLTPYERQIGFVFQNYALFRYMNVFDNIAFGLKAQRLAPSVINERVYELLELIDMKEYKSRFPNQLSGGQRQRVAFARALAPNPSLLLLDEPFAAIDSKVRKELRTWLRNMINKVGITSIFVTHDQDEAVEVADYIIVLNNGQIEQAGTPFEIYKHPITPFVSRFVGDGSVIYDYNKLQGFDNDNNYLGAIIRPEFVEAFKNDNPKFKDILSISEKGIIKDIKFHGNSYEVTLDVSGIILTTYRSLERRPISIGEKMNVIIYRIIAFDGKKTYLLENQLLKKFKSNALIESYLYSSDGYFVT